MTVGFRVLKYVTCMHAGLTFFRSPFEFVQHAVIMDSTQQFLPNQSKLLACGQLPLTGEAQEACQVVNISLRPAYPICGLNRFPTARAPCPIPPVKQP